jgi:hypothetical protein
MSTAMITSMSVSSFSSASFRASEGVLIDVSGKDPGWISLCDLLGPADTLEAGRVDE